MNINKISKFLYKAARISRDVNALSRGGKAIGKRIVKKAIGRQIGRFFRW